MTTFPQYRVDVTGSAPASWTVAVTRDGRAVVPPYPMAGTTTDAVEQMLERLDRNALRGGDPAVYGRWLFDRLLAPAWERIREELRTADGRTVEIALCFPADAVELHNLLWEAMHDGTSRLAGHPDLVVAVTRLVRAPGVGQPEQIRRVPRVLLAAGAALIDDVIRPGSMFMGVIHAIESDSACVPRVAEQLTIDALATLCGEYRPDIVQLVAHGEFDAVGGHGILRLAATGPDGIAREERPAGADALVPAVTKGGGVAVVVLNACRSGAAFPQTGALPLAVEFVAGGVPIVVAMTGDVSEQASRLYIRHLIAALAKGDPLAGAAARARRASLIAVEPSDTQLDWAMPALFVAESVDSAQPLVDPAPARRTNDIADYLDFRKRPVFMGRLDILRSVDEMFPVDGRPGLVFVGAVKDGPIDQLGATRLLQEMGYRLLHRGHLPLLLGHRGDGTMPADLRAVLADLLEQMALVAGVVEVAAPRPHLLDVLLRPAAEARGGAHDYAELAARIEEFRSATAPVLPGQVRPLLGHDLKQLVDALAATGAPFGETSRAVVLGDRADKWVGAIGDVLELVRPSGGLGLPQWPIPLVITASLQSESGARIKQFTERYTQPGFLKPPFDILGPDEAALGFQWVLLNPWRSDRTVFAASRHTKPELLRQAFHSLRGYPAKVRNELYVCAETLVAGGLMTMGNDEDTYRTYAEHFR